jgi:spore cortex formation protein SpoVR/YcgB (stage V sporulation)
MKLFAAVDDDKDSHVVIAAIHNDEGYRKVRQMLADQYNLGSNEPNIQVYNVNRRGDRSLTLRHYEYNRRPLAKSLDEVMKHLARLWGFTVRMETVKEDGKVEMTHETLVNNTA